MKWPFVQIFSVSMSVTHGITDPWMEAQSGISTWSNLTVLEGFKRFSLGRSRITVSVCMLKPVLTFKIPFHNKIKDTW